MTTPARIPTIASPHAEAEILATVLLDPRTVALVDLAPEHFAQPPAARIWETIQAMDRSGAQVDALTVSERLREAGHNLEQEIGDIVGNSMGASNESLRAHVGIVRDCWHRRSARSIGERLRADCDADRAMQALQDLDTGTTDRWYYAPDRVAEEAQHAIDHVPEPGIPTGFERFDERLGGLHRGELVIVAARPAVGKTAMLLNVACNADMPSVVFSGEQSTRDVVRRMLSARANVPLSRLRVGGLLDADRRKAQRALEWFRSAQIHIVDRSSPSLTEVSREARRLARSHGIRLLLVDYLQRMSYELPHATREENVEHNVRGLKELARDLDLPVVVAAQVNREVDKREDKVPTLADLLHSSAVEREADVVMTLYRERAYQPDCESRLASVCVRKNRSGPTGEFSLVYAEEYVRFENPPRPGMFP